MSVEGTNRTSWVRLAMSVDRGRPGHRLRVKPTRLILNQTSSGAQKASFAPSRMPCGIMPGQRRSPDFAPLHQDYNPLRYLTGKTREGWVNRRPSKYSYLQKFCFGVQIETSRPATRGVSRSSRDAGGDAVAATALAREVGCRAEIREQRFVRYDTTLTTSSHGLDGERTPAVGDACEDVRGRRSRVVLAPGVCASSPAVMCVVRPGTRVSHPHGDGGNSASLPGESTKDTVKTIRAGKAGMSRRHL
jgi:hypothetical protein